MVDLIYRNNDRHLGRLRVAKCFQRLGHHAVVGGDWHPITFPVDYRAYAQEALDDWQKHNTASVALLTGKSGEAAFSGVPAARRSDTWTFDHSEGAMGHDYYAWRMDYATLATIDPFAPPGSYTGGPGIRIFKRKP